MMVRSRTSPIHSSRRVVPVAGQSSLTTLATANGARIARPVFQPVRQADVPATWLVALRRAAALQRLTPLALATGNSSTAPERILRTVHEKQAVVIEDDNTQRGYVMSPTLRADAYLTHT